MMGSRVNLVTTTGIVCAFLATLPLTSTLRCLSCRGQNIYECIMSAMIHICEKGEECRFRMLYRHHRTSRTRAWFEAGCASVTDCRKPDDQYYAHFCCRVSYCNYLPSG